MKLEDGWWLLLGRKAMINLDSVLKSKDIILPTKGHLVKDCILSSSHVWMWELDHKECRMLKNLCFWTVALERTPESPLDSKEIQSVNPKGNQSWIFIGRTDAEAPTLWPSNENSWLTGKDPDAGKDWRHKRVKEDEMVGLHHWFNGHKLGQTLGAGER